MTQALKQIPKTVSDAIEESLALVETEYGVDASRRQADAESLPSLLEQCAAWRREVESEAREPIRLVHHFACTGGTLISKCLASLPNTWLLSEVDPLSLHYKPPGKFSPTDLISLIRNSNREVPRYLFEEIFSVGLRVIHDYARNRGLRIILRDHTHSHYCTSAAIQQRPTFSELVSDNYHSCSIVTVRDPIDSYLSLVKNYWLHFEPGTIDEYARRYSEFLDDYRGVKIFKYEDFVRDPEIELKLMCRELSLLYDDSFVDVFPAHHLSGDSGRSGRAIATRRRQGLPRGLNEELTKSKALKSLRERLGYGD